MNNNTTFTDQELYMLSDALLLAINNASEARKMTSCVEANNALTRHIEDLKNLNSKVCSLL